MHIYGGVPNTHSPTPHRKIPLKQTRRGPMLCARPLIKWRSVWVPLHMHIYVVVKSYLSVPLLTPSSMHSTISAESLTPTCTPAPIVSLFRQRPTPALVLCS